MKTLKTAWVNLTIDGTPYGLFTQVEHAGPRFLRERGFGDGGLLYKAKVFEFVPLRRLQADDRPGPTTRTSSRSTSRSRGPRTTPACSP